MNIMGRDVSKLKFKWMSIRTIYCCACALSLAAYTGLCVGWMLNVGVEFSRCVTFIFYSSNFLAMCFFLRLSVLWPKIMLRWQATESLMSPLVKHRSQRYLSVKLKIVAAIILSLSLSKFDGIWNSIIRPWLPFQLSTSCRSVQIFTLPISVPMLRIKSRLCFGSNLRKCLLSRATIYGKP